MVFVSRIVASSLTLNVAALSLDGDQPATEEDLADVTTLKLLQLAHQDQVSAAPQLDQVASTEVDSVEAFKAVVEEDSEEDSTAHAVVASSKDVVADSVVDMEAEAVVASDTNKMVLAVLQMVHQRVLVVAAVVDLVAVDIATAHNSKTASVAPVAATANRLDREVVDFATAMDSAAVLVAETAVAVTTPESAHTMEMDTMVGETSEGINIGATTHFAACVSMDRRGGCALRLFPFPITTLAPWTPWIGVAAARLGHSPFITTAQHRFHGLHGLTS